MIGERYGSLVVMTRSSQKHKQGYIMYECQCDCGSKMVLASGQLRNGAVQSCGCSRIKHGMSGTKPYLAWRAMVYRCTSPKSDDWEYYGGRGIRVCAEWQGTDGFTRWFEYVQSLPHYGEVGRSLDRINGAGNYEPGNVRWATASEQRRNQRRDGGIRKCEVCGAEIMGDVLKRVCSRKCTSRLFRQRRKQQTTGLQR